MTVALLGAPTLFGKLPTRGDFVAIGERGLAESVFAEWLTRAVEVARGKVPTTAVCLVARPVPGSTLIGRWVASHDAVGRAFPLVLTCRLQGSVHSVSHAFLRACDTPFEAWFEAVQNAARQHAEATPCTRDHRTARGPCASPDLPSLTHARLSTMRIHEFASACFAQAPLDNLCYALSVLQRASRLPKELTLDVPASSDGEVYVWLELLRASCSPQTVADSATQAVAVEPTLLLWSPAVQRALVCLGASSTELLVYLRDPHHHGHGRWPLWTQSREAALAARSELDPSVLDCIERDDTVVALLAQLGRAPR